MLRSVCKGVFLCGKGEHMHAAILHDLGYIHRRLFTLAVVYLKLLGLPQRNLSMKARHLVVSVKLRSPWVC